MIFRRAGPQSRISVPKDKSYSAASAVLLNELLKGAISLSIAFRNAVAGTANAAGRSYAKLEGDEDDHYRKGIANGNGWDLGKVQAGGRKLLSEVFRYVLPSLRPPAASVEWSKADSVYTFTVGTVGSSPSQPVSTSSRTMCAR